MKPAYEVITREIAAKGAGYLLLRRCPPQELGETLARGRAELPVPRSSTPPPPTPPAPWTRGAGRASGCPMCGTCCGWSGPWISSRRRRA